MPEFITLLRFFRRNRQNRQVVPMPRPSYRGALSQAKYSSYDGIWGAKKTRGERVNAQLPGLGVDQIENYRDYSFRHLWICI